jgi:hypothetical protein
MHQAAHVPCVAPHDRENVAAIRRDVVGRFELRKIVEEIPANLSFPELEICSNAVAHSYLVAVPRKPQSFISQPAGHNQGNPA